MPGRKFNLYEHKGIVVLVHPELASDILPAEDPTSLALIALQPTQVIRSRGTVKPEWVTRAAASGDTQFSDGGYLVVTRRPQHPFVASLAATPVAAVVAS